MRIMFFIQSILNLICGLCYTLALIFGLFTVFVLIVLCGKFYFEPLKKGKCTCKTLLSGKIALITGGNSGIGLETARNLAKRGARVIIASRNIKKSEEAVQDIIRTTGNNNVEYMYLDLAKFSSVRKFGNDINNYIERLDILVINAGCGGIKEYVTEDNINIVIQINYVAQFLLTNLLLEKLIKSKPSRIVIVSSLLHKIAELDINDIAGNLSLNKTLLHSYNNSKLLQILWAKALARKAPKEVVINTLHPGLVRTNIFQWMVNPWRKILYLFIDMFFKTAEEGAQTVIHLCVSPNVKRSGDYYVDCKKYEPSKEASNEDLIHRVWDETMKLVQ